LALYAFCRVADDEVDEGSDKAGAVLSLGERLDRIYRGQPRDHAPDRAFAAVVADFDMPRALPEALLEGLAWDALGRRYQTLSGVLDYSARVAASVGAMMCVLMRVREADALARACDLGLAMQLTNIARDVGEDARAGRLFLPLDWLTEEGIAVDAFLADPRPSPGLARVVARLLQVAEVHYRKAASGVSRLPLDCRAGIFAAGHIYGAIGHQVAAQGHDSVTTRARTSGRRKLALLGLAGVRAALSPVLMAPARLHARPALEVDFLVQAAAQHPRASRSETLIGVLAQLKAQDRNPA